jgi:hypothetical protein
MIQFVYVLSLFTSLACGGLLLRAYRATRTRLLLWTALCFGFLALNNLLILVDVVVFPDLSLLWLRQAAALAAVTVLAWGLISEAE